MTQIAEFGTPTPSRGRQIKFTPERIQQIKNLVERGKGRKEIAELIGTTVGSLQVTCSRLGISLRRPDFNNGIVLLRRNDPRLKRVPSQGSDHVVTVHYCTWNEIRGLGQWSKYKPLRQGRRWSKR